MKDRKLEPPAVVVRGAALNEIIALRHDILIVGTDRSSPEFPGDHDDATRHFGAFDGDRTVGCATFLLSEWEGRPAWQLRGMATHPDFRSRGVGKALLVYAERTLREESPIHVLWCNARAGAASFYEKHGWRTVSDEFLIEGVGPHRKMVKKL